MNLIAKYIFVLVLAFAPLSLLAQPGKMTYRNRLGDTAVLVNTAVKPPRVKGPPALAREFSGGIKFNSDGYGIFLDKGWLKGGEDFGSENKDKLFNVRLLEFELMERKHPKEKRTNSAPGFIGIQSNSYILGKVNNFYVAKLGYGNRRMIAGKPDPGCFSIHWVYLGGVSVGLVKPYYLRIYGEGDKKYVDSSDIETFINPNNIEGRSSFFKGFNELKVVPGLYFKTGLHFDFSSSRKTLWALEIGINGEAYTQKIQQMVLSDPKSMFLNFYAGLSFGKLK